MHTRLTFAALLTAASGVVHPGSVLGQLPRFPARTQPFMAVAQRDLTFGRVIPGVPETVRSDDFKRAGLFEIQGTAGGMVRVEFLLPVALASAAGALLPITFGPGDGFADFSHGRPPRGLRFDPNGPLVAALGPNGRLLVRLGGTVAPARNQVSGVYHATIAITVFDLGV